MSSPYWLHKSLRSGARDDVVRRLYRIESLCTVLAINATSGPRAAMDTARTMGTRLFGINPLTQDGVTLNCLQTMIRELNPLKMMFLGDSSASVFDLHALTSALLYLEHKRIIGANEVEEEDETDQDGLFETIGQYAEHAGLAVQSNGEKLISEVKVQLSCLATRLLEARKRSLTGPGSPNP